MTEAIWQDMQAYGGYLRHVIVEDLDDPGHLIVVSEWHSRAAADAVLAEYAEHENAKRANALVVQRGSGRWAARWRARVPPAERVSPRAILAARNRC